MKLPIERKIYCLAILSVTKIRTIGLLKTCKRTTTHFQSAQRRDRTPVLPYERRLLD